MTRFCSAWETHGPDALREMLSTGAPLLVIGTDPNEWWVGSDVVDLWTLQAQEMSGMSLKPVRLTAHCIGNVGWVADEARVTFANGRAFRMRVTAVVVIERGHWRIAQWHGSVAQTNEEVLGVSLTTSIDKVERSVRDDRPDVRPASAPDGTVTIVLIDIESSTVLLDRLGDTGFLRLLAWHDRIVRGTAEHHRGFVVKSQGDGFILVSDLVHALARSLGTFTFGEPRSTTLKGLDGSFGMHPVLD